MRHHESPAAGGGASETLNIIDEATGPVAVLRGHTDGICDVRFSADGALIATGSKDNTVKVWDAVTGRELHTLTGDTDPVYGVAFHPTDSGVLVSCSYVKTAQVWTA